MYIEFHASYILIYIVYYIYIYIDATCIYVIGVSRDYFFLLKKNARKNNGKINNPQGFDKIVM